jgi:hypothetical protein
MSGIQDAIVSWLSVVFPDDKPPSFKSLRDGVKFIGVLSLISKDYFEPAHLRNDVADNFILCKANMERLFGSITTFVKDAYDGKSSFALSEHLDTAKVVDPDSDESAGLEALSEFIFTLCLTAGSSEMMAKVRTLPKGQQSDLQAAAKKVMTLHGIKKTTVPKKGSLANSDANGAPVSPASAMVKVFGSNSSDPTMLLDENKKLNETVASLKTEMSVLHAAAEEQKQRYQQLDTKYKKLLEEQAVGQSGRTRELSDKLDAKMAQIRELEETLHENQVTIENLKRDVEAVRDAKEHLQRDLSDMEDKLAEERQQRLDAVAELEVQNEKLQTIYKVRDDLTAELGQVGRERKNFEDRLAQRKVELDAKDDLIKARDAEISRLKEEVEEFREKVADLEGLSGLAANLHGRRSNEAAEVADENLERELRRVREEKGHLENALVEQRLKFEQQIAQLDAELAESRLSAKSIAESVGGSSATIEALQRENTSLKEHLQNAVKSSQDAQKALGEKTIELNAYIANAKKNQGVVSEADGANERVRKLEQQNKELELQREAARNAARLEQAAIFSTIFECGQRVLQIEQRQLFGAPSIPSSALFDQPQDSQLNVSFLEKARRQMEHSMLLNLSANQPSSPLKRK